MAMTRRDLLAATAASVVLQTCRDAVSAGKERPPLGMVIHSYGIRLAADRARGGPDRIDNPRVFLEYGRELGARGVQVGIGALDAAECERLRERADALGMYLEGIVRLPMGRGDLDRFTAEVEASRRAGALILRTVLLNSRRYETFTTAAAFREFAAASFRSLELAEPIVARLGVRLAVENHKDHRADELASILKRIDSAHVGVCLDTGNSIALLEDPIDVVEALAPWAFTTHFKDMGVREYEQGFLLAEVPLGEGFLDLARIVRILRGHRPEVRLNLEMITRDPLKVPCLTDGYWVTFQDLPGRHLARTLAMVRAHAAKHPLARISDLPSEEKIKAEDANVRRCLETARGILAG